MIDKVKLGIILPCSKFQLRVILFSEKKGQKKIFQRRRTINSDWQQNKRSQVI
jgi:hypothetical protein